MFGEFCVIFVKMKSKVSDNCARIKENFMKQLLKKLCVKFCAGKMWANFN